MTFCVVSNTGPAPTPQTLTIMATGAATQFDDNGVPASGIKVSPAAGNTSTANTVIVSIDPSFYAGSGSSYSGYIQVLAQSNGFVLYVPVTVNVDANCAASNIVPTPSSVVFPTLVVGTASTPALSFNVAGPSVQVSATNLGNGPSGWFTASQPSGSSQTVQVTANPSLLTAAQTYTGSITLAQVGNSGNTVQVPVSLTITATGTTTITYSPNPANFNVPANTTAQTPFTINLSGPATPVNIALSPGNGPAGWISLLQNGSNSSLPSTLNLTVNPAALQAGATYNANITITPQTGTAVSIPVSVTAGTAAYSVNPTSLTFTVPAGSTSVMPQGITLSGPSGVTITATATINNGSSQWLSVSPTSGTTNGSYNVSLVNPGNFTPGQSYSGTITFTQGSTTVASVPVTVNVGATNALNITPSQLNFQYQIGTTAPATQTITVTSPANTAISYSTSYTTTTCGGGWIVVSPSADATSGTIPRTVNVSLNTSALVPSTTPTTCNGTVTITAPSASTITTNIPVSVLVSNSALLVYNPPNMSFNYTPGGTVPSASNISLASTSSTSALTFTTAVNPATSGGPVFVTVTQTAGTSGTTPATLSVALSSSALANLAGGTYTDNIVITDSSTGNPNVVIPVTLTVSSAAMFVATPSSLTFNYQIGTNFLPSPTIILSSTGVPLQFNASAATTSCGNFLFVSPTAGSTSPSTGTNGTTLTVTAAGITSLSSPVTCQGTITVTSTAGATLAIPVTLNVVNQPVIDLGATGISESATVGSTTALPPVEVALTSSDNSTQISYSATATTSPAGGTWLGVTPQNFHTPVNLNVTLNPTGLAAGIYSGSIIVTDLTNSSPVPTQTIPVTFIVASPVTANPTSLTFTAGQGGAAPMAQTVTLTGVPAGVTIAATPSTTSCGSSWLQSSVTGNIVTVSASPTGLLQSQSPCSGQVSIVVPNAPNSPLNIPVTFNITSAISLTLSATTAPFTYNLGSTTPAAQSVTVSATGGAAVPFTAAATTQSGGSWLTVSPTSGTTGSTPAPLSIGLNQAVLSTLGVGMYQGTVTVASTSIPNGSMTVNVTLTVSMAATPTVTSIVNAATQQPGAVAPGEIVTLYGTNDGPTPGVGFALTSGGTVPTTLAGAQVFFDNTPAPLLYVGGNQINAIVPYEVAGRVQTNITVTRNGVTSTPALQQAVTSTSPGIFTQDSSGKGVGSILNQDQSVNGPNNPAAKGSVISIYGTGEGQITPAGVTGSVTTSTPPFPTPNAAVSVNFLVSNQNGSTTQIPATSIFYAGEAPALVAGVLQVNVAIPATVPTGPQTIVLTIGANSSPQTVTVYVQ